jgi:hypothetical protein
MGVPTVFMYAMSVWALALILKARLAKPTWWGDPVPWVAAILVVLAVLMLIEAVTVLVRSRPSGQALT